ncbi:hypothetical protein [Erwinia phage vB_Ea277G]|nr:hypothetical protein [Erwinia phage vB_Ea277G]
MGKEYNRHVVVTITGTAHAGKSAVGRLLQQTLEKHGLTAEYVETIPGDSNPDCAHVSEAIASMANRPDQPDIVIVDASGTRSPLAEFKILLNTMEPKLQLKFGDAYGMGSEKEKIAMRCEHLRDACRRFNIPFTVAALLAPQYVGKRGLWHAVE